MNTIQFFANKNCAETNEYVGIGQKLPSCDQFELQMWLADIGKGQQVWCGSLQNVSSGEKHHFKGWTGLVANLQEILTPMAQLEVLSALLPIQEAAYRKPNRLFISMNAQMSDV